ncbi:DUF4347 domain-containing protein, partial [Vibrio thalassae]
MMIFRSLFFVVLTLAIANYSFLILSDESSNKKHTTQPVNAVYIFDSNIKDIEHLTATIESPVYVINPDDSIISQLIRIADKHPSANVWNIVAHGRPGELQLGKELWNAHWLESADLTYLKSILPNQSRWHLYACDLAQGEQGKAFVNELADTLDISLAASINKTGVISGSDTRLEFQSSNTIDNKADVKSAINFLGYQYTLSLSDLQDYAQGTSTTPPSEATYTAANIINVRPDNLSDYNQELITQSTTLDFTGAQDVQALVDAINALDDYANGTTSVAPDVTTYHTAGFTDLRALHVELINNVVQTDGLNTLSSIASVIASLDAIQAYAIDSNATPPTLEQYTDLKLTGVSADILAYLNNELIKEKSEGLTHYLKASDAQAGDQFGQTTAMSRDGLTLAVLAWKAPSNNTTTDDAGAVYIYRRQGNSWQEVTILRTNQTINHLSELAMSADGRRVIANALNQAFVFDVPIVNDVPQWGDTWSMTVVNHGISNTTVPSLAINGQGNIMMVGSPQAPGMLRIYRLENSTWSLIQQLDEPASSFHFATHVDISDNGDVIVVGAHGETGLGLAFAYRYNGMQWLLEQILIGSEAENGDRFGYAVSLSADGSRVALSAPRDDGEANASVTYGATYIFEFTNNSWQEIALIRALSPMNGGKGVDGQLSPLGDKLATVGYGSQGVYVYDLSDSDASNWQASEYYLASPSASNDLFGNRNNLSFNGVDVLVGAMNDDRAFQGVVINSDDDADFDAQDNTSTGTSFDNTSTAASNSGAAYVVAYEPYALDSTAALQTRIDAVNIILAWAAGGSIAPSEQDYIDAEITNVTVSNLADINMQLQLLAHTDMFAVQPMVDSINVIQVYASDNTQTEPNLTDYATAGITGVSGTNLSDVNGQVDSQSLTPMASVQTMVDSLNIIQAYAADNTQPAPSITHYADIGVTGVDANNLSEINGQVDSQSLTTVAGIQTVVDSLAIVQSYAADNTQTAPTVTNYADIGVTGVDAKNLSEVNGQVESQSLTTVAGIQTVVDSLNVVLSYAADNTQTAPTLTNYADIGVTGVDANNLSEVNGQVDSQSLTTVAGIQTVVDSLNVVLSYAADNTQTAPTVTNYADIGVTGVDANNLSEINGQVDSQSLTTVAGIQTVVDSLAIVQSYAADNTQTAPTVTNYADIGVTGVDANNLSEINGQVDSQSLTTVASIQTLTDSVNVIQSYATDNTQTAPTVTNYADIGVTGVDANNLSEVNGQVDSQSLTTAATIQTVVDSLAIIQSYAADNTQTAPTVTNYADIGVTGVDANNLSEINGQVDSQSLTTVASIQTVVDSLAIIQSYAADNTQTAPTVTNYADIGVTGVDANNLSEINGQVDSQSLNTVASIQTVVDSVNVIQSYAADNTQTAPTVTNYADIGVTGVDANNLSEVNGQVDSQSLTTVAGIQTVVDSLNVVLSYAADNTQTAPTVTNYADIGVTGVDANNLSEVNGQVDSQSLTTAATIQTVVDSLAIIQSYAADNTQTAPTVTNYADIGVTGVDANNLSEVNGQVDSQSLTTVAEIQTLTDSVNVIQSYGAD